MNEKLVPGTKQKRHSSVIHAWYICTSAVCSFLFITTVFFLAVFYHIQHAFSDTAIGKIPLDTANNECYPDAKDMKLTTNLRYYAQRLGLDLLEYKVQTKDGYVLVLHRLVDPAHTEDTRSQMAPIFLQHGLLSSSGAYLSPGNKSLAVYFLKQGYDVWMGNNRSGFEPLHAEIEGNLMRSEKYWDWDVKDLAYYDLPCLIEEVLTHKPNFKRLTLVGHLQGCTQSFLLLQNLELASIHDKIETFIALTPAIYPGVLFHKRKFLRFMSLPNPILYQLFFGIGCFLKFMTLLRNYLYASKMFGKICVMMFGYLFEWTGHKWNSNPRVWNVHFIFSVSYVSSKLMTWWVCHWREDSFRNQLVSRTTFKKDLNGKVVDEPEYNVDDSKTLFPYKTSWFGGGRVVPMVIFNGTKDNLVDGKRLNSHMETYEPGYKLGENLFIYNIEGYSHLDVVWANDTIETVGQEVIEKLNNVF